MRDKHVLEDQIAFYRARAVEYDQSLATRDQLVTVKQSLRALGPFAETIELACGTGIWTKELVTISQVVRAIDASPEMIEINRRRVASAKVEYQETDLFDWQPDRAYDLLFTAFWLSHVPPDRMVGFLEKIQRAVRPRGWVYLVDQCNDIRDDPQGERSGIFQQRRVNDGRPFTIVKVYYHPALLAARLSQFGIDARGQRIGESFFTILGRTR